MLVFLFLFSWVICADMDAQTDELVEDLQTTLDEIVNDLDLPGITMSIALSDDVSISLASGYADREGRIRMRSDDRMLSGSVGKSLVSAIALRAFAEHGISLDTRVSDFLSDKKWYDQLANHDDITLRDLMQHTSGLARYIFQPEMVASMKAEPMIDRSPESCIAYVLGTDAVHEAGNGWQYSDTNYLLLGMVLEQVSGRKYNDILRDFLIENGLNSTEPSIDMRIDGLVQGYIQQDFWGLGSEVLDDAGVLRINPAFEWTGGGVVTSSADLAHWMKQLHEGHVLDSTSYASLISPVNMRSGEAYESGYGLGAFVWARGGEVTYGHSGFFPGYLSHAEYSTSGDYGLAFQINTDGGYPNLESISYRLRKVMADHQANMDEAMIRGNFKKQEDCWNAKDIECYMLAYAPEGKIQTASRGGVTYGYDNIISDYRKYFPKERMGNLHFDNITLRRLSDELYFVTGRFNLKYEGREQLSQGWFSANMKRIKGKWYMITDHSS